MKKMKIFLYLTMVCSIFLNNQLSAQPKNVALKSMIVAGGCFWCIEHDMAALKGVTRTEVGYIGGEQPNPTYEDVSSQSAKGYYEALQFWYDPQIVSTESVLNYYFKHIDPTDGGGQFCDRGLQYSTAIFYTDEYDLNTFQEYIAQLNDAKILSTSVQTALRPATTFLTSHLF